ncbi:hypothetical protein OF829_02960 [Sphingomonas sp. LB-2]|uniref:hypothetical protein n=1 Tax=Sphingomonas caeni TaxID=2984949 RepID=UPI002231F7CE|nr:hypothetical protein [Sphingomonas caeni]MCW3846183.1 hypothetical protein [Sphingomonas caeni]
MTAMILATLLMLAAPQDAPPVQDAPRIEEAPDAPPGATLTRPHVDADGTQRWSILADPCAAVTGDPTRDEIVVCGSAAAGSPRLPLPAERGPPDRPMPSNPYVTGRGALAATVPPCATLSQGCTTGIDLFGGATALVRLMGKAVDPGSCCETPGEATNPAGLIGDIASGIGRIFKRRPDRSKRIPIPLDDPNWRPPASGS